MTKENVTRQKLKRKNIILLKFIMYYFLSTGDIIIYYKMFSKPQINENSLFIFCCCPDIFWCLFCSKISYIISKVLLGQLHIGSKNYVKVKMTDVTHLYIQQLK